uniref:S-phase kinase associated protein 2 n=1 Tax=Oncorhynchus mykiss TaxID=8022 RepID=A0A8C7W204_ONCMY
MLSLSLKSKWKKRQYFGECLDTETTPHELIQQCSPPHKQRVVYKGKENEENQFVLARRPRTRREFSGLSWDSLPDELLLGILSCLPLQDLLRMSRVCKRWHRLAFDESLWHSVDLVGKAQLVLGLRCPHTCIGEPYNPICLLNFLSDNIVQSLSQNTVLVRLNLCGCSEFSPDSLSQILKSCLRLEELILSWCDFSTDHVKAVVSNIPSNITQLNLSGYRQNLTMEDLVERCPNLVNLDLSDSVLMTSSSFPILQQLQSLRLPGSPCCLSVSHRQALNDYEKFPELQTLEVYGLVQDTYLPILSKGLPSLQINTRPFSGVARPTEATWRDRTMWGMTCRWCSD